MANYSATLTDVSGARDPTRRAIVRRLAPARRRFKALAAPFTMALPSFMKHLGVLERSGVIRSRKAGRVRTCELRPPRCRRRERWLAEQRAIWEARTDRHGCLSWNVHRKESDACRR